MSLRAAMWAGIALVSIGLSGLVFTGFAGPRGWSLPGSPARGAGTGAYAEMMGGAGATAGAALLNNGSLTTLIKRGTRGAAIDRKTNTVTYGGKSVTLVALASPHGKPNMTWEIDGLVNPTMVVRPGTHLRVDLVNMDWGYMHGFELTTTPPPYPYMAMMGISNNFLVMPLPARTSRDLAKARYYERDETVALSAGAYYYLCPVPGHAQRGMYGRLVVTAT